MGYIHYGGAGGEIHIEDRALAHLKVVIATKLRLTFEHAETPQLNVKWIEQLMHSANSTGGISLTEEFLETPAD